MPVAMLRMREETSEFYRCTRMALTAGFEEIVRVDRGFWIIRLQDRVSGMTIGAPGYFIGIAETVVLAVVALHIRLDRDIFDLIALHHRGVAVAFHASPGVERTVAVNFHIADGFDLMEVVAVIAGRSIFRSIGDGDTMDRVPIDLFGIVALDAFLHDPPFVVVPWPVGVHIGMALRAPDVLRDMDAQIMLGSLFFVASVTVDLVHFYLPGFVEFEIGNFNMAAIAAVLTMD